MKPLIGVAMMAALGFGLGIFAGWLLGDPNLSASGSIGAVTGVICATVGRRNRWLNRNTSDVK